MTKPAYELSDAELVRALSEISQNPKLLKEWEGRFARDLPGVFVRYGRLTWKQRQSARLIVGRVMEALAALHNRPDLLAVPTPPFVTPPPPPQRSTSSPRDIARRLSTAQRKALEVLADGQEHATADSTRGGRISGGIVRGIRLHGLVSERYNGTIRHVKITQLGMDVFSASFGGEVVD